MAKNGKKWQERRTTDDTQDSKKDHLKESRDLILRFIDDQEEVREAIKKARD